jgi:hypothetical protein
VQIDPNTQAPIGSTLSQDLNAPAPSVDGRRNKKGRKGRGGAGKVAPAKPRVDGLADVADVEVTEQVADGTSSAVIESTDLDAVIRRLRSGAYNTREVAEAIARRLLASGDL